MSAIKEMVCNKADELAMQFYGKDYFELEQRDKDEVMNLANMAVSIDLARQVEADIEKITGTGIACIDNGGD